MQNIPLHYGTVLAEAGASLACSKALGSKDSIKAKNA